ncbi:MAG: LysR family transcriptional regulator [Pseudorhodoferax sp.]
MMREDLGDLLAFLAVARERSFTRAASKLGLSQSALSHTVRALETRLGVRLLARTTRSVVPTEAGERLLERVAPRLDSIAAQLQAVSDLGSRPGGRIRIVAVDHVVDTVLWPRLRPLLRSHPELHVEISADDRLAGTAAEPHDLFVRRGDQVAPDMVAVRLQADQPMAIVATPAYLAAHGVPAAPQDLLAHNCITLRLPGGGLSAWELGDGARGLQLRVAGQASFNGVYQMRGAALSGCGLALLPRELVLAPIAQGQLRSVLEDWCPVVPGAHACYAGQRRPSRALQLVVDALALTPTAGAAPR